MRSPRTSSTIAVGMATTKKTKLEAPATSSAAEGPPWGAPPVPSSVAAQEWREAVYELSRVYHQKLLSAPRDDLRDYERDALALLGSCVSVLVDAFRPIPKWPPVGEHERALVKNFVGVQNSRRWIKGAVVRARGQKENTSAARLQALAGAIRYARAVARHDGTPATPADHARIVHSMLTAHEPHLTIRILEEELARPVSKRGRGNGEATLVKRIAVRAKIPVPTDLSTLLRAITRD